jgi:hypothetical protein
MKNWNQFLSRGMMKPVFYNLFSPEGAEYTAVVEMYPWDGGAGLGKVRTNYPTGLEKMQDIIDLRSKGYLVINSIATCEWALLQIHKKNRFA